MRTVDTMETTNQTQIAKLDGASLNIAAEKRRELLELFPEIRTDGDAIDFEQLKITLGESVDSARERYGLTWPGKAQCFKTIQAPSAATLLPCPAKSIDFETTENLIIEGDNLEVLKVLQKSYLSKIKMIYIDPPYNTGNDFIYPDDYSESLQTYLQYTGQVDAEGKKFGTNSDTEGRFHSKWLNMMYPRLYLARNLLRDDGVIFISIDDVEVANLRKLADEIFGEENFLGSIVWQKKYAPANDKSDFSTSHDYILTYAKLRAYTIDGKVASTLRRESRTEEMNRAYSNADNDPRGPWKAGDYTCNKSADERPNLYYAIKRPDGTEIWPKRTAVWRFSREYHERNVSEKRVWWGSDGKNSVPAYKRFLSEVPDAVPQTVWLWNEVGHTDEAKKRLRAIFPEESVVFDTPKPVKLIERMIRLSTNPDGEDIVLDFFAGSGTTAEAVLSANQDGGNRRFILVQLPEAIQNPEFKTIADLCEERVRRVIRSTSDSDENKLGISAFESQDRAFRVFRLAQSNVKEWDSMIDHNPDILIEQLNLGVDHLRNDRSDLDIVYEILLKSGYPVTAKVADETIEGKCVYSVADGAFLICLDRSLTLAALRAIAARKPERVLLLDEGFAGNDQLKANAVQTFTTHNIVLRTL